MAILVTGGAGYIGSHTVAHLRDQGEEIVIIDNLARGHREAVLVDASHFYEGDVADGALLDQIFRQHAIDAVVHFAAWSIVPESVAKPLDYYQNNVVGAVRLVERMLVHGVNRFVFSSTAATYGNPVRIPLQEDDPTHPTNPYGETKLAIERMLEWCSGAYGLRAVSLRYFNAAGAHPTLDIGEDHAHETHLIPLVLKTALGQRDSISIFGDDYDTEDGTCVRDYIHILDLADAHGRALERLRGGAPTAVYNLGNGTGFSVRQIVERARAVTGSDIPVVMGPRRSGDPAVLVASSERARRDLGWQPRFGNVDDIIATAWRWHQSHPYGYAGQPSAVTT